MKLQKTKHPASLVYPGSYGIISFTNSQYIINLFTSVNTFTPSWNALANVSKCPSPKKQVFLFLPFPAIRFSWSAGVTTVPWWRQNVAKPMARVWWPSGPSGWSEVSQWRPSQKTKRKWNNTNKKDVLRLIFHDFSIVGAGGGCNSRRWRRIVKTNSQKCMEQRHYPAKTKMRSPRRFCKPGRGKQIGHACMQAVLC